MSCEALCSENTMTREHANVSCSSKQGHSAEDEIRPCRISILDPRSAHCSLQAKGHFCGCHPQYHQKCAPIKNARLPVLVSDGHPCCCHQVEGESASQNIAWLGFQKRHVHSACAQAEHGDGKYL